jgi:hypothetical protein
MTGKSPVTIGIDRSFFLPVAAGHTRGPTISEAAYFPAEKRGFALKRVKQQRCMRAGLPPDRQVQDFL